MYVDFIHPVHPEHPCPHLPPPACAPAVQPGDEQATSLLLLHGALLLFGGFATGIVLYRIRTSMRQVEDSAAFDAALQTWLPVIAQHRATPRALKRFGNRIRYLVMLQQGEELDHSLLDEIKQRWQSLTRQTPATGATGRSANQGQALAEHHGALHEVYGDKWRDHVLIPQLAPTTNLDSLSDKQRALFMQVIQAEALCQQAGNWPPAPEELAAFERSLRGVRVGA